ncbi:response regulator transcription factor [Nocardioides fonticola]|uniref:Response regulator transcription factor n=1 Tax=Nocardioides fonticola TaxID=450363 RepID=A0ABP7XDS1_9ACTN
MRVVIAEDEVLLRRGLESVLTGEGFEVVAAVGDAPGLLAAVAALEPDLAVTDIRMPPGNTDDGLQAASRIREQHPGVGVMVLSQHAQRSYALTLLGDNPRGVGYLLKQRIGDIAQFVADLRRVAAGGSVLDPEVVDAMVARATVPDSRIAGLTPRQREVLGLVAEGRSNVAIGERLCITEKAVVQHISNIYEALGLAAQPEDHRRVLAVLRYLS